MDRMKRDSTNRSGWREFRRDRSGQAMTEFVVALVCILVLVAGIIQISVIGLRHTRLMGEARREAGQRAMLETSSFSGPRFVAACGAGPDDVAFSRDDTKTDGDVSLLTEGIAAHAHPDELNGVRPDNAVSVLASSPFPHYLFGLIESKQEDSVDLIPVVRALIFRSDTMELKASVWMTWTKGLY